MEHLDGEHQIVAVLRVRLRDVDVVEHHAVGDAGGGCIPARGLDRCLFVFTEEEWRQQERKFKDLPFTRQESRKFNRLYFSGACEVVCDKQGRILIPVYLKSYAEIKSDVVIIGVSDRIEIWAKEKWERFFKENQGSFEELAEKLVSEEREKSK